MSTETNFEERWPELFANLTPTQHEQAVAACWYVLNDGFTLERESVERITTLLVDDPQQFAILYGPYTEADDTRYAELADRAERGELRVKPGTERHGAEASAEIRQLLAEDDSS
ncbi:hypothetical protein [Leucobacter sp. wl10]|uniref:hypothetical protein n=1 Tax=Leucobacter sp. wl10 TaxID=2304677 RepID=UPI000E5A6487|nr:hypothetical protein [Leucobacter sp. wl10]RGE18978.1 hypothetical protein D1J51_13510 [Leucobacter sp. wl10]